MQASALSGPSGLIASDQWHRAQNHMCFHRWPEIRSASLRHVSLEQHHKMNLALIITIKRTKDLNYFSLCALHLFNTQVSQFELNY